MAGHSKWANIQHRKGRQDERRGAAFSRLAREVTVAAKMGGGDSAFNPRLRLAIDKAKAVNMPKDKIENAIKKGTGEIEGTSYTELRYEGYGPGGIAIMLDCLTDNHTRTVAEVRFAFSKNGGNLGTDGSVAYMFQHCGQFVFAPGASEDVIMNAAIEAGAEDVRTDADGSIEVLTLPSDFLAVRDALEKVGLKADFAEVTYKPLNEAPIMADDAPKVHKILEALENLDDVQAVYSTAIFSS